MKSVILELVRESLIAVVNEMRANMIYASYSSVIFEGHDFSCALLTADGLQIAQGQADHPIHIFAVPASAAEILTRFAGDIHPGDVFLHNDPYTGGTHLNDMLMLYPVFDDGALIAFAAVRAHWNDVGGMTPGSLSGKVSEIVQEGIRVPPIRIARAGVMNDSVLALLFANMRVENERRGDFNSMLGTCRKAEEHVLRLSRRFGRDRLTASMNTLIDHAATRMREAIAALPDGIYHAEGHIESDGHSREPRPVRLALTIAGDRLTADFTGTAEQVAGPTNAGKAMAANAVFTITKAFLDPHTAINHGSFQPIEVVAPVGTMVNAVLPAPCGGMAEVKFAIDSVVAAALGQAVPDRRVGDTKGTANHMHITAVTDQRDRPKILYEWPAGGTGATAQGDGNNVLRTFAEGDFNSIHAIEVIEKSYPLRVVRSAVREGSCGDGLFRGGFGLLREIELMGDAGQLSVLSDRNIIPPYGVNGGLSGAPNRFTVLRDGREIEPSDIPGKVSGFALRKGDIVRARTAGGGGWGDPLERDPARVAEDIRQGYLTPADGLRRYGVALDPDGAVDAPATTRERSILKAGRLHLPVAVDAKISRQHGRRLAMMRTETAERLGVATGQMIEILAKGAPTVRAWVAIDETRPDGIVIDPDMARTIANPLPPTALVRALNHVSA